MSFGALVKNAFNKDSHSVFYNDMESCEQVGRALFSYLPEEVNHPVVLVCIGTDRSTGDCLGPLVGSKLVQQGIKNFHVYGTLDEPVHALNLEETIQLIHKEHRRPFIVAVDACLGKAQSIGSISVGKGPSKPGAAMNKKLPPVGNIHIHGVVNIHGFMEFFVLQNTRLNLVMKMADVIASGIYQVDRRVSFSNKISHL